jgi:hypothetical protein
MRAEKWVLRRAGRLRAAALRRWAAPAGGAGQGPVKPPRGAAALAASAARFAGRAAWGAARVVAVYSWLWGLADYTFWYGTSSCNLQQRVGIELLGAIQGLQAAAAHGAGVLGAVAAS